MRYWLVCRRNSGFMPASCRRYLYALFGTSRTLSVGPVSIAAIMIASALTAPEISVLGNPVQSALDSVGRKRNHHVADGAVAHGRTGKFYQPSGT